MDSNGYTLIDSPIDIARLREVAAITMKFALDVFNADGALCRILEPDNSFNHIERCRLDPAFAEAFIAISSTSADPFLPFRVGKTTRATGLVRLETLPESAARADLESCLRELRGDNYDGRLSGDYDGR